MADDWVEQQFTVARELGLHARPSGMLVTLAAGFQAEIERAKEEKERESVLSVLED